MKLYTLRNLSFIIVLLTMPLLAQAEQAKDTPQVGLSVEIRVERLENLVQNLQNLIIAQHTTITVLQSHLNVLSNDVNAQFGQITALQTRRLSENRSRSEGKRF